MPQIEQFGHSIRGISSEQLSHNPYEAAENDRKYEPQIEQLSGNNDAQRLFQCKGFAGPVSPFLISIVKKTRNSRGALLVFLF